MARLRKSTPPQPPPAPTGRISTVVTMTLGRQVRDVFAEWSTAHTNVLLDTSIVNFHTPRDRDNEVVVILGLDESHSVHPAELSELRERVARIARKAGIGPVSITVRNLDSSIVVTANRWDISGKAARKARVGSGPLRAW